MKKHKNYIFVELLGGFAINADTSDGYLTSTDGRRVKLPHKNYTLLGIVDECIVAPYAEEFSKEIVDFHPYGEGCGGYCNYTGAGWCNEFDTAIESMETLIEKMDLKPTDYILKDESDISKIT
jgi:hypothetical protein